MGIQHQSPCPLMSIDGASSCVLFSAEGGDTAAPKFTAKPAIKQVSDGVLFEVRVSSDTKPEVTWYKGETVVQHGGRFKITQTKEGEEYILQLQISDIASGDGGTYRVSAKNAHGASNANLNLNLEGQLVFSHSFLWTQGAQFWSGAKIPQNCIGQGRGDNTKNFDRPRCSQPQVESGKKTRTILVVFRSKDLQLF